MYLNKVLILFSSFNKSLIKILIITVISFLTMFIYTIYKSFSNTSNNLDPLLQYNQSGNPYVAYGGNVSDNYNDLNVMGEGLTYDISETQDNGLYRVEVWHNSSQIADGTILSINTTINFTTNETDYYSLQIYDFANSQWTSSGCDFGNVFADTPTKWWCNITSSPMNYNSSDMVVRIRINSTADTEPGLLKEDYVQYYIGYQAGYLEVNLTNPEPSFITNVVQNYTFPVNATVICRNGPCGKIQGTIMYNLSSSNPDTPVNITQGDKPFFIKENPANALKSCGILYKDQTCQLNWYINATGDMETSWKIGVLFNSSFPEIQQNHTNNSTIYITTCTEEMNLAWVSIDFAQLIPSKNYNNATNNDQNFYNITNKGTCPINVWIKGTDLENSTYDARIKVGNISWSNTTNDYTSSYEMTYSYDLLSPNLLQDQNLTTYYWLFVPPVYAGHYIGSVYICGNYSTIC